MCDRCEDVEADTGLCSNAQLMDAIGTWRRAQEDSLATIAHAINRQTDLLSTLAGLQDAVDGLKDEVDFLARAILPPEPKQ